ncbi:MAG: sorbosone dehydrogenase, partial [Burkholderiaceae bacterium]
MKRIGFHPLAAAAAIVAGTLVSLAAAPAFAQANIDKLKQMKVSGTDADIPTVAQTGKNASLLRDNLKNIKLLPGFKIDLYAVVPDARSIA